MTTLATRFNQALSNVEPAQDVKNARKAHTSIHKVSVAVTRRLAERTWTASTLRPYSARAAARFVMVVLPTPPF